MTEIAHPEISQKQQEIGLEMKADALKPEKHFFREEYRNIFFDEVDTAKKSLKDLSNELDNPSVNAYIKTSQDKIVSYLRSIAEAGRLALNQTKKAPVEYSETAPSIETMASNLKQDLGFIIAEIGNYNVIKEAESEFNEAEASEKLSRQRQNLTSQEEVAEKQTELDYLQKAKSKLKGELSTPETREYFAEVLSKVDLKLLDVQADFKKLQLRNDPAAYFEIVKADFIKEVQNRIKDPKMLKKALDQFDKKSKPYLEYLTQCDPADEESLKAGADNLELLVRASLEKIPFDTITVEAKGQVFECHFEPKLDPSEYESMRQKVENTVETYLKFLEGQNFHFSRWNSKTEFLNGVFKNRLDYVGPDKRGQTSGEFDEITVDGNYVEFKNSSKETEEKTQKMSLFKEAFEKWQDSQTSDPGFWYDNPPIYVDLSAFIEEKTVEKTNILSFEFFRQNSVPEFEHLTKYDGKPKDPTGSQTSYLTYDKEENQKYLKTLKEVTKLVALPDEVLIITNEYYKPSESQKEKSVPKKTTRSSPNFNETDEYNVNGELIQRESSVPACPNIRNIYFNNGKSLEGNNGLIQDNIHAAMEWLDKEGKPRVLLSFPEMKKLSPAYTEDQYLDYMAQTLTTDALKHAWAKLMYQYTYDSPDPKDPLKKGTKVNHGEVWQSPEETVRRTESGLSLGDCEDAAILFQEILQRQSKHAYLLEVPGHLTTIVLEKNPSGFYGLKSYDNMGVSINGIPFAQIKKDDHLHNYNNPLEAIKGYGQALSRLGLPAKILGNSNFIPKDHHPSEIIKIAARMKKEDDPWTNINQKDRKKYYINGQTQMYFLPEYKALENFNPGVNNVPAIREEYKSVHKPEDAYYTLSVHPYWLLPNDSTD